MGAGPYGGGGMLRGSVLAGPYGGGGMLRGSVLAGPYGGGGMLRGSVLGGGGGARRFRGSTKDLCLIGCLLERGHRFKSFGNSFDDRKASEERSDADSAVPPLSV